MPRVPLSVMIVSILSIIYAGGLLLLMPCGLILTFHPLQPSVATTTLVHDPVYLTNLIITTIIWVVLMVMLLVGAIASLRLKPLGRKMMLYFAWSHLILGVVGTIVSVIIVMPRTQSAFAADPVLSASPLTGTMKILSIVGAVFSLLFYATISAIILYFFNRKIARDAFNGIFPAPAVPFPDEYDNFSPPAESPPASP